MSYSLRLTSRASQHPYDGSIGLELYVDQGRFLATPQATNLAGKWIDDRVISL